MTTFTFYVRSTLTAEVQAFSEDAALRIMEGALNGARLSVHGIDCVVAVEASELVTQTQEDEMT